MHRRVAWAGIRSTHAMPLVATLALFVASRVVAWEAGVRFDTNPLKNFWQFIDPSLMKTHLLQSVWYLDAQPPLYNLLVGADLKVFGSSFGAAAHAFQIGIGVAIAVFLYVLLISLGLSRWWAAAVAALFIVSPSAILYENWLFYEYLVAGLLLAAAVAFAAFQRRPSSTRSLTLFTVLAALCYIRASFQITVLLLTLALMLACFWQQRRAILIGALVPVLLVAALSAKDWVLFGTPSTSAWAGMNLMQVDDYGFRGHEEQNLQRHGIISPFSAIPVFSPLSAYEGLVAPPTSFAGIPVLREQRKPESEAPNYNNIEYVTISNHYLHDFVQILRHEPSVYLRGVWIAVKKAATPSSDYYFLLPNRAKIEPWVHGYDLAVLGQPRIHWTIGRPSGTAWGIVASYVVALLFGAVEVLRLLIRRRGSPTVAFVWLLLAYSTFVMAFGEVAENQRVRFISDPLVTVLVAVIATRLAVRLRGPSRAASPELCDAL